MESNAPKRTEVDFETIKEMVERYKVIKGTEEIKKYNEEMTKKDFILPLFEALGWNVYNKAKRLDRITAEETISKKRVDYGFWLNETPRFYLEAKSLKEADIVFGKGYDRQAINYSWLKSCNWAVLTNFETLVVYNAERPEGEWFFTLKAEDYLGSGMEQLELLSKRSFEGNTLDQIATKYGKRIQRRPVDKQLLSDLIQFREILSKDLLKNNTIRNLTQEDLDESVQRILDRLIFIRNTEDRGLESNELQSNYRQWSVQEKGNLVRRIREVYKRYDESYNSKIFSEHLCDSLEVSNESLREVIQGLYSPEGTYSYDFSVIASDTLGSIYEQYLGNILKTTPKRAKLEESKVHRKEQGIYYTPSYIVDYIVRNTVGEFTKTHTPEEIKNVKILDPACGSGSFLIKAYQELENYWREKSDFSQLTLDSKEFYSKKVEILRNNIFGVDLDPKAVEITQLNLLLKISEKKQRLPILQNNIKAGNSLIEDSTVSGKPFRWNEEFSEIMKSEGFDLIIGNPPWVFTRGEHFSESEKEFFDNFLVREGTVQQKRGKNIQSGKLNLYSLFILKSLKLMKNGSILGFIVPNNILRTTTYDIVRKYVLDNCKILSIADLSIGVFEGVTASSVVLILRKETDKKNRDENEIKIISEITNLSSEQYKQHKIEQRYFYDNPSFTFNILSDTESVELTKKICYNAERLGSLCKYIIEGIVGSRERDVSDKRLDNSYKPFLVGKDIGRYKIDYKGKWICYDRNRLHRPRPEEVFLSNKILIQRISGGDNPLVAALDEQKYYTFASINNVVLKDDTKYDVKYILALLNSKLLNWYYSVNFSNRSDLTVNISKTFLDELPIKACSELENQSLLHLVDKILLLNKESKVLLNRGTDREHEVKEQIDKAKIQIDKLIYKIYGLTDKEIRIVNGM